VRGLDKLAKRANVDADALADALLKLEQGEEISADDRAIVDRVLDELAPKQVEEVDENPVDAGMLALKKKKLELLMKGI
jgi:ribosome assembly protein YihI (activator of Der GTPase)